MVANVKALLTENFQQVGVNMTTTILLDIDF